MSAKQTQNQIVARLIQTAPIELSVGSVTRHEEDGPDFAFYMIGCKPCMDKWIRLSFVQGQEEAWESEAQGKLNQHLAQFHKEE
jgi:hypothetical protein